MNRVFLFSLAILANGLTAQAVELGIRGTTFTLNGTPKFLLGVSYYGALGATREQIQRDLDEMQQYRCNWIRVWATWGAFGKDVSAVDAQGMPREVFMTKLRWLVEECNRRYMVVDVTLSRGNGATGPARLQSLAAHRQAVDSVAEQATLAPTQRLVKFLLSHSQRGIMAGRPKRSRSPKD